MERKEKIKRRKRRKRRGWEKKRGTAQRPRLSVFRSLKHIYCQLIDDERSKTLASASDLELKDIQVKGKVKKAYLVGKLIAEKAKKLGIERIVFDRSGYKYHGRVKALANGAREGGLKF